MCLLAELLHNAVAHPLLAAARVMRAAADVAEAGATWLHDETARWAWQEVVRAPATMGETPKPPATPSAAPPPP